MGAFLSPINWVAGVTIPINGDITILTNNCYRAHLVGDTQLLGYLPSCLCQLPHAKRRHADLPQCQQSAIQQQHRDAPGRWRWKKLNIRLMVQKSQGQPPGMYETLKIVRYLPYHLVQNFFHQPYVWYMTCILLGESLDTTIKNTALLWTWNSNPAQMCVCVWLKTFCWKGCYLSKGQWRRRNIVEINFGDLSACYESGNQPGLQWTRARNVIPIESSISTRI